MDYDLYSNDWANVVLMRAEHMRSETFYFEQMHRWGLQHGNAWGVIHIGAEDFQVSGSTTDYSVSLSGCKAITKQGYIVDIGRGRPPITLSNGNNSHTTTVVPIYLGVAVSKEAANAGPSQTGALLDRPILRWNYRLDTEESSPQYDWILVGRLRRDGQRFIRDEAFIPQCTHLRSYPALSSIATEITRQARAALLALKEATRGRTDGKDASVAWHALVGTLVTSLTPAAVLLDWEVHPRAYLERLVTALQNYYVLLPLLQAANPNWTQAHQRVQRVVGMLEAAGTPGTLERSAPGAGMMTQYSGSSARSGPAMLPEESAPTTYWWESFEAVRDAIQALTLLFQQLAPISGPAPAQIDDGESEVRVRSVKPLR